VLAIEPRPMKFDIHHSPETTALAIGFLRNGGGFPPGRPKRFRGSGWSDRPGPRPRAFPGKPRAGLDGPGPDPRNNRANACPKWRSRPAGQNPRSIEKTARFAGRGTGGPVYFPATGQSRGGRGIISRARCPPSRPPVDEGHARGNCGQIPEHWRRGPPRVETQSTQREPCVYF